MKLLIASSIIVMPPRLIFFFFLGGGAYTSKEFNVSSKLGNAPGLIHGCAYYRNFTVFETSKMADKTADML